MLSLKIAKIEEIASTYSKVQEKPARIPYKVRLPPDIHLQNQLQERHVSGLLSSPKRRPNQEKTELQSQSLKHDRMIYPFPK